jgi:hypothetical protein
MGLPEHERFRAHARRGALPRASPGQLAGLAPSR